MNIVGRFLLSSSVYHLRAAVSGAVPGEDLGYSVIKNPDGSITVEGETLPGSEVVITWPDGSVTAPVVDTDGSWSETSPPGQPDGEVVVEIDLNAVQFDDGAFEIFDDGSFVIPEINLISSAIMLGSGGFEVTDSGEYITFNFE